MKNEDDRNQPVRQSVQVDCPVEDAFRLFTESFASWWPGDESEAGAVDRGSVTVWDPPGRIEFTWRRDDHQTVTVDFRLEADGTRVTLTHYGWQHAGAMSCAAQFGRFVCEQMMVAA